MRDESPAVPIRNALLIDHAQHGDYGFLRCQRALEVRSVQRELLPQHL
jgi:hypothetical protein